MSINISKLRKDTLIAKIDGIKEYLNTTKPNQEIEIWLNDIKNELCRQKYGLNFEEHQEKIDTLLETHIPLFTEDKELTINKSDNWNFLLEGDNLASLNLLRKTHKEQIDYIYIDPPYNTKSKDFLYDDNFVEPTDLFKHSKWLSFMQKRLIIAHELLRDSGAIMLSINEEEVFGLKLLCDEIFGSHNYLAMFSVKVRHEDRILKGDKDYHEVMEYLLVYRKTSDFRTIKRQVDNTSNVEYVYQIVEKTITPEITIMDQKEVQIFKPGEYEIKKVEASTDNLKKINIRGSIKEGNSSGRFFMKHLNQFIGDKLGYLYKVPNMGDDKFGFRYFLIPENLKRANGDYFQGVPINRSDIKEVPYANYLSVESCGMEEYLSLNYLDFEAQFNNVGKEGYVEFRNGKKPLAFLEKCFELGGVKDNKDAVVLDFFAGSGSTGHALMRLNAIDGGNRKFILCTNNESNICRDVTYERIKLAIEKEDLDESLKYYKVDYLDTIGKVYYEYADTLLAHIRELIQLDDHIAIDDSGKIRVALTDEEVEVLLNNNVQGLKLYLGYDVLLDSMSMQKLGKNWKFISRIPDVYYSNTK